MNRIQSRLAVLVGLLSISMNALAGETWDAETAMRQASHRSYAERVAKMLHLTPWLPASAIQDQVDAVILDSDLSEPAREKILRDYAYQLRDLLPDAVVLGTLQSLAAYPSLVLVAHPESRGQKLLPLFDVAGAAEGTINQWLHESARARTAAELEQGDISFLQGLTEKAHYQQIAGTADAVRVASFSSVQLLLDSLPGLLAKSPKMTPIVLAAAYRLQDESLLRLAIEHGDDPSDAINRLLDFLPAEQAGRVLFELAEDTDSKLAGLAITALARYANSIDGVNDFLISMIGDRERGAAAALALAQIASPEVLDALVAVLRKPADLLSQSRAALALKLDGSDRALALLRDFAQDQQGSELSSDVQKWVQ